MRAIYDERGVTLIELVVSLLLTMVVYAAVLTVLQVFVRDNNNNTLRDTAQSTVRTATDQVARQLRSIASPAAGSPGALEVAGPYQLIFQAVEPVTSFGGSNASNQFRVRYCLSATNPSNETLYKQIQTWTTAGAPAIPSTATCPAAFVTTVPSNTAWGSQTTVVSNLTNDINGQNRPLFIYPLSSSTSQINGVEQDMFIDLSPGNQPGETELKSGSFLRNSSVPPVAAFTPSEVGTQVVLDASASTDPNGQVLTYQWYAAGACPTPSSVITGATTQQYTDAGPFTSGTTYTFAVVVTDTGGLSSCATGTLTFV